MNINREISKSDYDEYKKMDIDDVMEIQCSKSELYGYGVYGFRVEEENGKYFIRYVRGDSCD